MKVKEIIEKLRKLNPESELQFKFCPLKDTTYDIVKKQNITEGFEVDVIPTIKEDEGDFLKCVMTLKYKTRFRTITDLLLDNPSTLVVKKNHDGCYLYKDQMLIRRSIGLPRNLGGYISELLESL